MVIQLLTTCSRCGPTTLNVILSIGTVIPSDPLAFDGPIRFSAAESSGRVTGLGVNAPLKTRRPRGERLPGVGHGGADRGEVLIEC